MANNRPPMHVQQRPANHEPIREPEREPERAPKQRTRTKGGLGTIQLSHDTYLNRDVIPPDTSVEWKLFTAVGQEYPGYLQSMRKQGWEPANPQEHPEWFNLPPNYPHQSVIVEGLIAMERPMWMTQEARQEMREAATEQIAVAKQRLGMTPENTLTRDHDGARPRVQIEMMRPVAIED